MTRAPHLSLARCIALGATLSLLTGCTVGPNYHRPAVPLPSAYAPTAAPATTSAASLGDLAWWNLFHDPDLQTLIRQALADNPDIKIAAARVDFVQAEFLGLRASYEPQINAQLNETQQRISPIGLPKDRTSGNPAGSATILGAQASWEIDFWGKYRRADQAARATILSSHAARNAVRSSLVAAVATAYFNLLQLDEELKASNQLLTLHQQALALLQARLQQGVSALPDVHLAEIQLQQQHQNIALIQQAINDRESEIRSLLGETTGPIQRASSLAAESLPAVAPGLPSSLIARRPDIQQAEQDLIAANANIGVVKAQYFPNIGLTAGGGLESTAFHNLFSGNAATWLLQPAINIPVFTGGRIHAQILQADAQRNIAAQQYVATVQSAFRDVAQALTYRAQTDQIGTQQATIVAAAQDSSTLASARLDAGVSSSLEVIQSDQNLINARIEAARIKRQQLDAVVHLYRALGGGWQP